MEGIPKSSSLALIMPKVEDSYWSICRKAQSMFEAGKRLCLQIGHSVINIGHDRIVLPHDMAGKNRTGKSQNDNRVKEKV